METKRLIAAVGVISLITLMGAGCSKGPNSNSPLSGLNTQSNGDDTYNNSLDLEIPDSTAKAYSDKARSLVESVLGKVKITSFLESFPSKGGLTVEFTANRTISAGDVNTLTSAVKAAGYTIDISGIQDGSGAIIAHNSTDTLMLTFRVGEPKIGVITGPKDAIPTGAEDESSS